MKKLLVITLLAFAINVNSQEIRKIKVTELESIIKSSEGPLIINFWATFCIPCIEEMPHFQKLAAKYEKEGLKLLLVSLDMEDDFKKVGPFVKKRKITTPVVWLDETNADYFIPKIDDKWSGAIPATLFINNKTGYRKFIEEQMEEDELEKEIMAILKN
jgi:thiol-disulfide isomerase/thioredoxin